MEINKKLTSRPRQVSSKEKTKIIVTRINNSKKELIIHDGK